jgi:hypothetical protein
MALSILRPAFAVNNRAGADAIFLFDNPIFRMVVLAYLRRLIFLKVHYLVATAEF